jgi:hypothetical protein
LRSPIRFDSGGCNPRMRVCARRSAAKPVLRRMNLHRTRARYPDRHPVLVVQTLGPVILGRRPGYAWDFARRYFSLALCVEFHSGRGLEKLQLASTSDDCNERTPG